MKKVLILISAACLLLPAMALGAGNANPYIYLEIDDREPVLEEPPIPAPMCYCEGPPLKCYRYGESATYTKNPYQPTWVYLHIAKTENGFRGVAFGMSKTSGNSVWTGCNNCPDFLMGPCSSPSACIVSSTGPCHQWQNHPAYCTWTARADVNVPDIYVIVASSDLGHHKVMNCDFEYDDNTSLGHGAEWAPTQSLVCGADPTAVELTTWGAIKGLYR
jgi:hypothetical protein